MGNKHVSTVPQTSLRTHRRTSSSQSRRKGTCDMSIIEFMQQEQEQTQASGQFLDYVSPSRLSLWMKCPLAFRLRYIEGLQTAPTPALFVGKITHSILAHIYRMRGAGQNCEADNLPILVADAWKFGMETEPPLFESDADEEKSRYQILDLVTAYDTARFGNYKQ